MEHPWTQQQGQATQRCAGILGDIQEAKPAHSWGLHTFLGSEGDAFVSLRVLTFLGAYRRCLRNLPALLTPLLPPASVGSGAAMQVLLCLPRARVCPVVGAGCSHLSRPCPALSLANSSVIPGGLPTKATAPTHLFPSGRARSVAPASLGEHISHLPLFGQAKE